MGSARLPRGVCGAVTSVAEVSGRFVVCPGLVGLGAPKALACEAASSRGAQVFRLGLTTYHLASPLHSRLGQ